MSPDDKSRYEDKDDYQEDDIFKKYSYDEEDDFNKEEKPDREETWQPGKHAKRFSDSDYEADEEEQLEKVEDDFFSDKDFEFRDSGIDDYDDDGLRSSKIREKRKKRRIIFTSIAIMAILVALAIGIVFGYRFIKNRYFDETSGTTAVQEDEAIVIPDSIKLGRDMSIVIACAGDDLVKPDIKSVVLSKYTAGKNEMVSLCMPANALFDVPGFGQDILSESVELGGMDLMKLTVKSNIGVDVENYLLLDVINIVNKLESIKLVLTGDLTIENAAGSAIELKAGENILNGETAFSFLSYFSGEKQDVPVTGTGFQKMIIDSIMQKISGTKDGDLAKNLSKINDYIETDLNLEELAELVSTIAGLDKAENKIYTLEGRIVPLDEDGNIVIVPDISKVGAIFGQEGEVKEEELVYETGQTVSVTVLNGVGIAGIAGKVSDMLKGLEFSDGKPRYDMKTPADAENYDFEKTLIILKAEDSELQRAAQHIAEILMLEGASPGLNEDQESEIVVIIGKDFNYDAAYANLSNLQGGQATGTDEDEASGETSAGTEATAEQAVTYTMNILNGEGTQGIASTVKGILEDSFNKDSNVIEVKETKNADNFSYNETKIIIHTDKSGIAEIANRIKDTLGVGIVSESADNPDNVDITVILGSDYTK